MTSVVYYKFKSQKEPSEISFDGTGISVFDLKKEILIHSKLAAQADSLDLQVINPDTKEEYVDDTEVIPRSMSVVARRLPAAKPGVSSAAKYVSGAMPTGGGKNAARREDNRFASTASSAASVTPVTSLPAGSTEEDVVSAMFDAQGDQWNKTQEHMANAAPVYYTSHQKSGMNVAVPDHPPPPGYICYRCGSKGHWIQACPTNNDPNWEGKRVRKTTGIPRTMLRTVAKPAEDAQGTYMINERGEYVEMVSDSKSWQTYQDKTKAMNSKVNAPDDPELVDSLTGKLFEKPVKTPCCKKTYSEDAIQSALLESDFVCPNCKTEEVLLDSLIPDKEMEERIAAYKEAKEAKETSEEPKPSSESTSDDKAGDTTSDETKKRRLSSSSANSDDGDHKEKKAKEEDENKETGEDTSEEVTEIVREGTEAPQPVTNMPAMPGMNGMPMMPPFMMPGMPMPPFMMPGMPMPPFMMPQFMNNGNNGNGNQMNGPKGEPLTKIPPKAPAAKR